jgi:4-amino-4-deoxy-L-arabinose transferase-like glycosyltransferase
MKVNFTDWAALILTAIISAAYWYGVPTVPFHPDESTQIFMSGDIELFINNPANLVWREDKNGDARQIYRMLDAPLTRDFIGIGRAVFDLPATPVDWNWSETWDRNNLAGALPSADLLKAARVSVTWLFPFSLILTYLIGKKISGPRMGLLALIFLASNALVLLHTRRAMAESVLLFTTLLALWSMLTFQKKAWLAAVPVGFALATKQSGAALILTGVIILAVQYWKKKTKLLETVGIYLAVILAITIILNPFLWSQPVNAALASFNARQELTLRQVNEFRQADTGQVLDTIPERTLGILANLYFTPLQFNEVGNYLSQTQPAETAYLANPLHTLFRNFTGGIILLFLAISGFVLGCLKIRKYGLEGQRELSILILTTFIFTLTLILTIPLAFQRYIIPLVPLTTFLIAYLLNQLLEFIWGMRRKPASSLAKSS